MSQTPPPDPSMVPLRALRLTWAGLWGERVLRAFWPFATTALTTTAALGFGISDALPASFGLAAVIGAGLVNLGALGLGLWRLRPPTRAEALARLDATLPGQPIAALVDTQAIGAQDPASRAVWAAHLARMQAVMARARPVAGDLRLARFDRYGLRYAALTAFVTALIFGAPSRVSDLADMSQLPGRAEAIALGPSWEGWVQPPDYTGRPSLYLNEIDRPRLELPQGSQVIVRFYGQNGVMTLQESLSGLENPDPAAMAQDFTIERSGRLSVRGPAGRDWEVVALIDQPPRVALEGVAERERGGLMRQTFSAGDDYGVVAGEMVVSLDLSALDRRFGLTPAPEARDGFRIPLPMPMSGARTEISDSVVEDFSQHPWANLPVKVALQVTDARGQIGESAPVSMTLPGRRFFDPMAAAVIELRRDLLWSRENAARVAQLYRAIGHLPEDAFRGPEARIRFTQTREILLAALETGPLDDVTRDDLAQRLWDLAVLLEDGELADARERLRRAQERLDEAVRNGADPAEIADLMDELREAMREYMRQLAEQPREPGQAPPPDGESMEITQDQIQQLLERIQELMEEGRMDEAAELLAQLNALLENLQMAEGQSGEGQPGDQAMEGLGQSLREQQNLADDTFNNFQQGQGQGQRPQQGQPQQGQGEGQNDQSAQDQGEGQQDPDQGDQADAGEGDSDAQNGPGTSPGDLAQRQRELAEQLREQQLQPLPGEGTAEGEAALDALERAQRAMEEAAEALGQGNANEALNRQADAMEAMRDGLRAMGNAQRQAQREAQPSDSAGRDTGSGGTRDPLGRDLNQGGDVGTQEDMLQGEQTYRRAQDLLEELRRRSAELDRPEAELDYLRRLLDRF
jgi:uncharacterized protein (TIGR02302 family)